MSWLDAFLTYTTTTLFVLTSITVCYCFWFRRQLRKLAQKVPTISHAEVSSEAPAVARYSEFKHRYGSRTRDIAIICNNKQRSSLNTTNEFIETMREHGSLLYHFTSYWGNSNVKQLQAQADTILRGNYHAVLSIGVTATRLMKHASLNQSKLVPIVFGCVRDTWWEEEQRKKPAHNMTGVTGSSGWTHRIKMFHAVKPDMRNALIPATLPFLQSDLNEVSKLLQDRGITPHVVKIHDAPELINTITHYPHDIDALICLQDSLTPTIAPKISAACAQKNIAYFSPYAGDTLNGAAMTMSCTDMRIGWHLGQKMIDVLEEYKAPSEIPNTNIGIHDYPYQAHFNQHAMKAQGLDPSILTSLALQYGSSVHVNIPRKGKSC